MRDELRPHIAGVEIELVDGGQPHYNFLDSGGIVAAARGSRPRQTRRLEPASLLDASRCAAKLVPRNRLGTLSRLHLVDTVRDLLFHLPRRYDDFSRPMTLRELREHPPEGPVSAEVEVVDLRVEAGFRRRVQRTVARLRDETGDGEAIWFGRRYIERRLARRADRRAVGQGRAARLAAALRRTPSSGRPGRAPCMPAGSCPSTA